MKTFKIMYSLTAIPFRIIQFIFSGPNQNKSRLAGRYTRPASMDHIDPSTDSLIV